MQPEKQIEKLHEVMQILNKDNATSEEVKKIFELALKAVESVKAQLSKEIANNHGEVSDKSKQLDEQLVRLEESLANLETKLTDTEFGLNDGMDKLVLKVFEEIKRVEASMPVIPDLTPIEVRISEVEAKIPTLPDPVVLDDGSQIVDKINDLPTDDDSKKIDAKHIKNLPKTRGSNIPVGGGGSYTGGRNISISTNIVSLNIPVSDTAPSNPVLNMLWIDTA